MNPRYVFLSAMLVLGVFPMAAQAADEPPKVTEEGLHLVKDSALAVVYANPEADISGYQRVLLLDAYVAFRKNWKRDQNRGSAMRASDKDMERIRGQVATEFQEVFRKVLEEGGYPVVTEAADDVLLVRPAIIDLNPTAPDLNRPGRSESYSESAGDMTLYVELYDSVTGALIAKGIDKQVDPDRGYMMWRNSASNKQAADRVLRGWAEELRDALDAAKAGHRPELE